MEEPTDIEIDQAKLRNAFDRLKDVSNIEFRTEAGKEIQAGLQDAWKIIKPYLITLAKELK